MPRANILVYICCCVYVHLGHWSDLEILTRNGQFFQIGILKFARELHRLLEKEEAFHQCADELMTFHRPRLLYHTPNVRVCLKYYIIS